MSHTYPRRDGTPALHDAFFSPGILSAKEGTPQVELVKDGKYKGWYIATLSFFRNIGGKVEQIFLYVYARSPKAIQEFLTLFFPQLHNLETMSLADVVNNARSKLEKKYKDEIIIHFKDETGDIHVVTISINDRKAS